MPLVYVPFLLTPSRAVSKGGLRRFHQSEHPSTHWSVSSPPVPTSTFIVPTQRNRLIPAGPNGTKFRAAQVVLDENGQATIALPEGALKPGENTSTTAVSSITINADGSNQELVVRMSPQPDPNDPNSGP